MTCHTSTALGPAIRMGSFSSAECLCNQIIPISPMLIAQS